MNALGAYYSYLGKIETKQREKEEHFILATQYYNKASRIDMHEPSTWVGKGECSELLSVLEYLRNDLIGWPIYTRTHVRNLGHFLSCTLE